MDAGQLRAYLRQRGLPVLAVKMPSGDRATWIVEFAPEATAEDRAAAAGLIAAIDDGAAPVPQQISRFQAMAVLHNLGRLEEIDAALRDVRIDPLVTLGWDEAPFFARDSVLLRTVARLLGFTDTQLDDFFRAAAQLRP